jgi:GrpB-like predicted nucleotidyltransferase (UPF0157 family)
MPEHPPLGLARSKTILRAHDPRWATAFETEAVKLHSALGGVQVRLEHVGSTAVPGLLAKPILDIAVGYLDASETAEIQASLESAGYVFHGDEGEAGGLLFIKRPESFRTHHLHVVAAGSHQWENYLAFRDALRSSRKLRIAYAGLKRRLAAQFPYDRLSYQDGKSPFIEEALGELDASSR